MQPWHEVARRVEAKCYFRHIRSEEFAEKLADLVRVNCQAQMKVMIVISMMMLPDSGDDGDCICVTDTNFLWEDMDDYNGQREIFIGMSGCQHSAQDFTNVVGIFELFFAKDLVQQIVNESNCYAQQFKDSSGSIFSK
jgi:hypothetical protein